MAGRVKTWVWVVVGIAVVCILMVIAMAGAGFYFFSKHIQTTHASATTAAGEFEAVRAKFQGQKPLIELDARGNFLHANTERPDGDRRPEVLHVLAFDPDDGGLVRVNVPFWLLRMKSKGAAISLGSSRLDLEDLKLTVEDLDRYGPLLVLDQKNEGGERVLVWSQ
jgi:Kef-type K+ transport system membrane component KefB